jgi:hypothetical protein
MVVVDKENWEIEVTNEGVRMNVERRTYSAKEAWELMNDIKTSLFDWHGITGEAIDQGGAK